MRDLCGFVAVRDQSFHHHHHPTQSDCDFLAMFLSNVLSRLLRAKKGVSMHALGLVDICYVVRRPTYYSSCVLKASEEKAGWCWVLLLFSLVQLLKRGGGGSLLNLELPEMSDGVGRLFPEVSQFAWRRQKMAAAIAGGGKEQRKEGQKSVRKLPVAEKGWGQINARRPRRRRKSRKSQGGRGHPFSRFQYFLLGERERETLLRA